MASHMQQKDDGTTAELEISCDDSAMPPQNKNGSLQDSELTIQSEGGSAVSEDETSGWLGAIGSDFRNIASCFKDNIPPVIGGVANLVHQTAMSVAAEIAQLERDGLEEERWKLDQQSDLEDKIYSQPFLPWEIRQQSDVGEPPLYRTDEALKEIILGLSLHENTFLEPYHPGSKGASSFELNEQRITLIERLLEIDENLAVMHGRFSGRSPVRESEADFWKNYFFHCGKVRKEYLGEQHRLKHENKQIVDDGTRQNGKKNCRLEDKGFESKHLVQAEFFTNEHPAVNKDEFTLDDDESLVPASVTDDSSYVNVIPSAPNSMNTFMTTRSIEDLVVIDRDGENCN